VARTIPPDRLRELVACATRTFVSRGYRLTQMADVAEALGVGKGTLYGYVESKEALFDAAIRYADGHVPLPEPGDLPLPTPAPGATVAFVRERLAAEAADLVGAAGLSQLDVLLAELYARVARNRFALKLVDRCAADVPELAAVWFGEGRWAQHRLLVEAITQGIDGGRYRAVPSPEVLARTLLEAVAFWAMHRHFDPSPQDVTDDDAVRSLVDLAVHALAPPKPARRR
jgi:AcrR family transcriptional regulator